MIFGTKIYTVHIHPDKQRPYEQPVFVREGFSFIAFLFTFLWLLYQRLWVYAIALVAFQMGLMWLVQEHLIMEPSAAIISGGVQALVGFHGHDLIRARLRRKGYILADISAADSLLRAEQRFFERYLSAS